MHKKNIFRSFLLSLMIIANAGWAIARAGGDLVNNGGGLAERNILFAYNRLEFSLRLCLNSDSCRLSSEEMKLLTDIYEHLNEERINKNQIVFISETKFPGTFIVDGEMKAAVTGSLVGSPIYINIDLLYFKKNGGMLEALSIGDAVAMLVHEFGHHHGKFSHTKLDLLGLKVSQHLNKSTYQTPLLPNESPLSAVFINGAPGSTFPEILLYSNGQTFNLSERFKNQMACRLVGLPISIIWKRPASIPLKKPEALLVNNVYWEVVPKKDDGTFKIKGNLTSYCSYQKNEIKINRNYKFEISFSLLESDGVDVKKLNIDEKSIKIKQIKEPWLRILAIRPF